MARMRTYVCIAIGLLFLCIVMIVLAQDSDSQGKQNSSVQFQTKQVFSGTFTIALDAPTMTLGSLDLTAYSNVRYEAVLLDTSTPDLVSVSVNLSRGGCPVPFAISRVGCFLNSNGQGPVSLTQANPFYSFGIELPGKTVDVLALGYTNHAAGGTAKIAVTVFGRP